MARRTRQDRPSPSLPVDPAYRLAARVGDSSPIPWLPVPAPLPVWNPDRLPVPVAPCRPLTESAAPIRHKAPSVDRQGRTALTVPTYRPLPPVASRPYADPFPLRVSPLDSRGRPARTVPARVGKPRKPARVIPLPVPGVALIRPARPLIGSRVVTSLPLPFDQYASYKHFARMLWEYRPDDSDMRERWLIEHPPVTYVDPLAFIMVPKDQYSWSDVEHDTLHTRLMLNRPANHPCGIEGKLQSIRHTLHLLRRSRVRKLPAVKLQCSGCKQDRALYDSANRLCRKCWGKLQSRSALEDTTIGVFSVQHKGKRLSLGSPRSGSWQWDTTPETWGGIIPHWVWHRLHTYVRFAATKLAARRPETYATEVTLQDRSKRTNVWSPILRQDIADMFGNACVLLMQQSNNGQGFGALVRYASRVALRDWRVMILGYKNKDNAGYIRPAIGPRVYHYKNPGSAFKSISFGDNYDRHSDPIESWVRKYPMGTMRGIITAGVRREWSALVAEVTTGKGK